MHRNKTLLLAVAALLLLITPACALGNLVAKNDAGPAPTPSFTPKPTFTPTVPVVEEPIVAPTFTPTNTPEATPTPADTPTPEASPTPEATATPEMARLVINNPTLNVRSGPGTNFSAIGQARSGERYDVTGKNAAGAWYQINFNGQTGWVAGEYVIVEGDASAIQVAANIPAPPIQPTRPPAPTAAPQPTAPPAPTSPPASAYEFNIALVQGCRPQEAGNWFDGTVYKNRQPVNGARVVFSYAADGPAVTAPAISGPHPGYEGWAPGYYSHVIRAPGGGPAAGNWFVWIVNEQGGRISEIANWQSAGPGGACNEATVDFDSR